MGQALEYQGDEEELQLAFKVDIDGDGVSVGVELATGADPYISDIEHPNHFRLLRLNGSDQPIFSFGYVALGIYLSLSRSDDLINFTTIQNSEMTSGFSPSTHSLLNLTDIDIDPVNDQKFYYRLEAIAPED